MVGSSPEVGLLRLCWESWGQGRRRGGPPGVQFESTGSDPLNCKVELGKSAHVNAEGG